MFHKHNYTIQLSPHICTSGDLRGTCTLILGWQRWTRVAPLSWSHKAEPAVGQQPPKKAWAPVHRSSTTEQFPPRRRRGREVHFASVFLPMDFIPSLSKLWYVEAAMHNSVCVSGRRVWSDLLQDQFTADLLFCF